MNDMTETEDDFFEFIKSKVIIYEFEEDELSEDGGNNYIINNYNDKI